jgi:ABC-2 type transport system permease protein
VSEAVAERSEARRFVDLTVTLALTEFKLRYFGNALGYFWTLAKPLMLFGVLYLAFTKIIHFGGQIPHYPAYLITAIVLFSYFSETTTQAVSSLVARESLIRKIPMPLTVIPLSISLHGAINLALNLVAVLVFVLASGVEVTWRWIEMPLLIACLIVITTAVSALIADLYVSFRDMGPIWEVAAQLLFWGTPVVYTIAAVTNHTAQRLLMFNPLAVIMTQMRHALIDPTAPTAVQAMGGALWLAVPAAIVLGVIGAGFALHRRTAPLITERV